MQPRIFYVVFRKIIKKRNSKSIQQLMAYLFSVLFCQQKKETGAKESRTANCQVKKLTGELAQSKTKHSVSCLLKQFMPLLPLTSTMTRRKQTDTLRLPAPSGTCAAEVRNGSEATQIRSQQGFLLMAGCSWRADQTSQARVSKGYGRCYHSLSNQLPYWEVCRLP